MNEASLIIPNSIQIGLCGLCVIILTIAVCECDKIRHRIVYSNLANILRGYYPLPKARKQWADNYTLITYQQFKVLLKTSPARYSMCNAIFLSHYSIQRNQTVLLFPNFWQYALSCRLLLKHQKRNREV